MLQPKDYLGTENARNKQHAALYVDIIRAAFGANDAVLIGHHLTFEANGDINTENEIPSADTLIFDHAIMGAVFGAHSFPLMRYLATLPVDGGLRDAALAGAFAARESADPLAEAERTVANLRADLAPQLNPLSPQLV